MTRNSIKALWIIGLAGVCAARGGRLLQDAPALFQTHWFALANGLWPEGKVAND